MMFIQTHIIIVRSFRKMARKMARRTARKNDQYICMNIYIHLYKLTLRDVVDLK